MVLMPKICISTSISNSTQKRPQHFRNFMRVHRECAWCQCQILVLGPPYPKLHKYTHKHFRNFMCVHRECAWCQYQIFVLQPPYPTLQKYTRSNSESSRVPTGNVRGASAKFWSQNHHIQHYTNTPTAVQKLNVLPLGMCMVLMPKICSSTSISNSTQKRPQHFRNFMCVHRECAWCQYQIFVLEPPYPTLQKYTRSNLETSRVPTGNVRGDSTKFCSQIHHIQHYKNTPTAVQKLNVLPLGMCVVLMPNIRISTIISYSTQKCPQHFRNFMRVYWECAWCQQQILALEPPYTKLHKYTHRHFRNFKCAHWECAWCYCQILVLEPPYSTLHKYAHTTS